MWTRSMACSIWWAWAASLALAFQAAVIFSQADIFPLRKCAGIEAGFYCISISWQAPSTMLGVGAGSARGHGEKKDFMSVITSSRPPLLVRIPVNVSPEGRRVLRSSNVLSILAWSMEWADWEASMRTRRLLRLYQRSGMVEGGWLVMDFR